MKFIKLKELKENKNLKWKVILLIVLLIIFLINLVVIHTKRSKEREQFKKELEVYQKKELESEDGSVANFGTEVSDETEDNGVANFDTKNFIINLEEYASPLLGEHTYLLEESLLEYLSAEKFNQQEAEIFYVMIPENDEAVVHFFLHLLEADKIVKIEFHMESKTAITSVCSYTEDEILSEAWEGESPSDRDIRE